MKNKRCNSLFIIISIIFSMLLTNPSLLPSQTVQEAGEYFKKGYELFKSGKYRESIDYYNKSLKIIETSGNWEVISTLLYDIGDSYNKLNDKQNAVSYYIKSLDAAEKTRENKRIEMRLRAIATLYFEIEQNDRAEEYYQRLYSITIDSAVKDEVAFFYESRGSEHNRNKRYDQAADYFKKAITIYTKLNNSAALSRNFGFLGAVYNTLERHRESLDFYLQALAIEEKDGDDEKILKRLDNVAWEYVELDDFSNALKYDLRALSMVEKKGSKPDIAKRLYKVATRHASLGQTGKAVGYYQNALALYEETGDKKNSARCYLNISSEKTKFGEYTESMTFAEKALSFFTSIGDKDGIFSSLIIAGEIHYYLGEFDKALAMFKKAHDIASSGNEGAALATVSADIGNLYFSWGRYDSAIDWFGKALKYYDKVEKDYYRNWFQASCLLNIGTVYKATGKPDKALEFYEKALAKFEILGTKSSIALCFNNIGTVYLIQKKPDKAKEFFQKASVIFKEEGMQSQAAMVQHNIGLIDLAGGRFSEALDNITDAIKTGEKLGEKSNTASYFDSAGMICLFGKENERAIGYLKKAIDIKEELRLRADGELRRDYLASQIRSYQFITSAYIRKSDPDEAFKIAEFASAKYLAEMIKAKQKGKSSPAIEKYFKKISDSTLIVKFFNVDAPTGMAVFAADKDGIIAEEVDLEKCLVVFERLKKTLSGDSLKNMMKSSDRGMGMKLIKPSEPGEKDVNIPLDASLFEVKDHPVESIVNTYRSLLTDPGSADGADSNMQIIAKELYDLLFSGIADKLKGKETVIIIPDGILGFLPFETLVAPDGKYLIDTFHVKYTQSIAVSEMIENRKYSKKRKSCIAFGGALYNSKSAICDEIGSEEQLVMFKQKVNLALKEGIGLGEIYGGIGICGWNDLPGTLDEVKAIRELVKGSEIHTGSEASEAVLKKLSSKGKLKDYRVVHFATHGVSVPDVPSLSAIVLSMNVNAKGDDDGYLVLDDVTSLKLNADFVNLSACQTGLGKIYGGEGVVGLSQSFIVAGANGVSVSLWNVNDVSTMEFMKGLYGLCAEKGMKYDEAMTMVKRDFIHGKYSHPSFWAPFVYYGK